MRTTVSLQLTSVMDSWKCLVVATVLMSALAPASQAVLAAGIANTNTPSPVEPAPWHVEPNPDLPNVLILGDSISIGYTPHVRSLLQGEANVFRPASADGRRAVNCEGTTVGLAKIDEWLGDRRWDVIHFNWGLHDLKHVEEAGTSRNSNDPNSPVQADLPTYRRNLESIVARLQQTGARLVFATTTPVAPETRNPRRETEAPVRYNAAAREIMQARGVRIDDLFTFAQPRLAEIQQPQNVHFTPAGSRALAEQVASAIREALASLRRP